MNINDIRFTNDEAHQIAFALEFIKIVNKDYLPDNFDTLHSEIIRKVVTIQHLDYQGVA